MPPKNEVVDDPTDLGGTLRPNLPPEPTVGTHFTPYPAQNSTITSTYLRLSTGTAQ
jgi:hypothetical protein